MKKKIEYTDDDVAYFEALAEKIALDENADDEFPMKAEIERG